MIRKPEEFRIEYKEHMRDGDGTVQLTHFITGPEQSTTMQARSAQSKRATSPSVRRAQATVLPTRLMRSWSWWR